MYVCMYIHTCDETANTSCWSTQLHATTISAILYAYPSNFKFPLDKCIIHVLFRVFFLILNCPQFMYIKWLAVHQSQNTGLSILTEFSFALSLSGSKANWVFFLPGRMVIWRRSLVMHTHFLISLTRLVFWSTGSHPPTLCIPLWEEGGRKEEGGGWLRTLSLTLFSARSFPTVHCWSLEETNQALNEWIYCSIWSV